MALLRHRLAGDAIDLLESFPRDAPMVEQQVRDYLLAWAWAQLGDSVRVQH